MEQATSSKAEVIIAGAGGQGVLFSGMVLAEGGRRRTRRSPTCRPTNGEARRHCECTVILSHDEIASPFSIKQRPSFFWTARSAGL